MAKASAGVPPALTSVFDDVVASLGEVLFQRVEPGEKIGLRQTPRGDDRRFGDVPGVEREGERGENWPR